MCNFTNEQNAVQVLQNSFNKRQKVSVPNNDRVALLRHIPFDIFLTWYKPVLLYMTIRNVGF